MRVFILAAKCLGRCLGWLGPHTNKTFSLQAQRGARETEESPPEGKRSGPPGARGMRGGSIRNLPGVPSRRAATGKPG